MPRESVHLAHVAAGAERFGIQVVRGEMITAAHLQPREIAIFARHPVQALNAGHHAHIRQQPIVAVHQQLGPRPIHRHGLNRFSVTRETAVFDNAARFEKAYGLAIAQTIERHGQIEFVGAHAKIGAGHRDAPTVTGQLKLRRRGMQRTEHNVAVRQNEHAPTGHAPMHTAGHLQYFVGAQMEPRKHIAPTVHNIGKACVINDDRVEPLHVQGALPGCRHRQHIRLADGAVEERANHTNGFAAVIKLRRQSRKTRRDAGGDLLHTGARRQKNTHATVLLDDLLQELVVEKIAGLRANHLHVRRHCGIERGTLHHARRIEILRVKRGVHGGRKPNEPAAHALAQREAELKLGARLVNFIHHQRVLRANVAVLKPTARDARGHNHHVPAGRIGRGLTLAVDHPHAQLGGAEKRLRDWLYGECFAGTSAGHNAEALTFGAEARVGIIATKTLGQLKQLGAAALPKHGFDVEREGQLDRLARSASWGDDDNASSRARADKGLMVRREVGIPDLAQLRV